MVTIGGALRQWHQVGVCSPVLMTCWGVAALGNHAAAVPEEVMLDRELTRTGSTLSSKQSSRSSALASKLSTRSSAAPRYGAQNHTLNRVLHTRCPKDRPENAAWRPWLAYGGCQEPACATSAG